MECEALFDSYIYLVVIIYNLILLFPSILLCDSQTLLKYPNNLPVIAGIVFFITAIVDYLFYAIEFEEDVIGYVLDAASWVFDYISRLCLLVYSVHRIKTLVHHTPLIIYTTISIVITFGSFCFLLAASVFDPTYEYADVSLGIYTACDLFTLAVDFYLAFLVSGVGRIGQGIWPRIRELITGPGLSILIGSICSITSFIITKYGLDPYYFYYTFLFITRIFMLQIFNIKLIHNIFKKKIQKSEADLDKKIGKREVLNRIKQRSESQSRGKRITAKGIPVVPVPSPARVEDTPDVKSLATVEYK
jgi:hypothetical protein